MLDLPQPRDDGFDWALPARLNMAAQCLAQDPDRLAVLDLTGRAPWPVTFGALDEISDGLARALAARVRPGDRVGVLLGQSAWCPAAHLAIWKLGAISVPLFFNPSWDANVAPQGAQPISAGPYLEGRFRETYLHLKEA